MQHDAKTFPGPAYLAGLAEPIAAFLRAAMKANKSEVKLNNVLPTAGKAFTPTDKTPTGFKAPTGAEQTLLTVHLTSNTAEEAQPVLELADQLVIFARAVELGEFKAKLEEQTKAALEAKPGEWRPAFEVPQKTSRKRETP